MTWLLWFGLVVCVLAVAAVGLTAFASKRWTARMAALTRGLEAARNDGKANPPYPTHCDPHELEGLPAPVQRYFRAVLKDGQAIVSAVTIEMAGTINMSATAEQWKPFTSMQRVVTASAGSSSGFIWDAKIAMLPGIKVHVIDSYIAGKVDLARLSFFERMAVKLVKSPVGDKRDWDRIRQWANGLGEKLQ